MAFIITVANAKGGVGKSTLSYCLSCYYSKRGAKVAILDEDIQQTISDNIDTWTGQGVEVPITLIDKSNLGSYEELAQNEDFDMIFIDTPPVLTTQLGNIYDISDMILIPIKPSTSDFNSFMRSIDTLKEAIQRNPDLVAAIVINMAVSGSTVQEAFRKHLDGEKGIKMLDTVLHQRVIHTKYLLESYSLFQSKDKEAKREMAALGDEIYYLLTL